MAKVDSKIPKRTINPWADLGVELIQFPIFIWPQLANENLQREKVALVDAVEDSRGLRGT